MVEAKPKSYKERQREARAAARAKRQAEKAEWHRQITLMAVVRRLSLDAAKATIRDRGDKVCDYDPAQLRVMADAFIGPWLILKAKERIAARKTVSNLWTVAQRAVRFPNDHALHSQRQKHCYATSPAS